MLEISQTDEPKGLRIAGEIDLATAAQLQSALAPLVRQGGEIALDIGEMRFIDSSGVQVLIRALGELGDRGRLLLLRPRSTVRRLVKVVGLQRFDNLEVREEPSV